MRRGRRKPPADLFVAPCGCRSWTDERNGDRRHYFVPHSLDCELYLWTIGETARQGKRVIHEPLDL